MGKGISAGTFGTKVLGCTCAHVYQDARYGNYRRVHNACSSGWRCSVCLATK